MCCECNTTNTAQTEHETLTGRYTARCSDLPLTADGEGKSERCRRGAWLAGGGGDAGRKLQRRGEVDDRLEGEVGQGAATRLLQASGGGGTGYKALSGWR